jgi:hypothetical protein
MNSDNKTSSDGAAIVSPTASGSDCAVCCDSEANPSNKPGEVISARKGSGVIMVVSGLMGLTHAKNSSVAVRLK